jgi:hypothetical protein
MCQREINRGKCGINYLSKNSASFHTRRKQKLRVQKIFAKLLSHCLLIFAAILIQPWDPDKRRWIIGFLSRLVTASLSVESNIHDHNRIVVTIFNEFWISLFPTLIPLSGVGTTCFSSCCDEDSAFILYDRPPAWL